jgi:hypothetical protein
MANMAQKPRSFSGDAARRLLRRARTASLGTINQEDGGPYVSLVNIATDVAGLPIIFVSTLAWHTRNLSSNPQGSIMVAEVPAEGDALTGARVTVMGRFEPASGGAVRVRYLARHPAAETYIGFSDFAFWRLRPERVHAVAGFGRIETLPADEVFPSAAGWEELEAAAVEHMNGDHAEAVELIATRLLKAPQRGWKIRAIDPDGCDLVAGEVALRLEFDQRVASGEALRCKLAGLARQARMM